MSGLRFEPQQTSFGVLVPPTAVVFQRDLNAVPPPGRNVVDVEVMAADQVNRHNWLRR